MSDCEHEKVECMGHGLLCRKCGRYGRWSWTLGREVWSRKPYFWDKGEKG